MGATAGHWAKRLAQTHPPRWHSRVSVESPSTTWPVWAAPSTPLATTRPGGTRRDVNPPSGPPGRVWRRPRPAVLCPPSWGERGGERGRVGEQAGGSPPWARAGWSSPSASSGRDRPPEGTRAHARGTGVVGRPRWASVRQWSRGSTAAALQQAARRGPAQHQPLRVRNRKGWVESGRDGPVWGPLPPRQQPSPARGAMASSQRPHLRAVRVTSLTPRLRTSAGAALT